MLVSMLMDWEETCHFFSWSTGSIKIVWKIIILYLGISLLFHHPVLQICSVLPASITDLWQTKFLLQRSSNFVVIFNVWELWKSDVSHQMIIWSLSLPAHKQRGPSNRVPPLVIHFFQTEAQLPNCRRKFVHLL